MANLDSQFQVGDRHKSEITLLQHEVMRQSCTNVETLVNSTIRKEPIFLCYIALAKIPLHSIFTGAFIAKFIRLR